MKKLYIVAVSGGVDSVVLLHRLVTVAPKDVVYIVAHYDHGIRTDSDMDAMFVENLAKQYGVECVVGQGSLGSEASEDEARTQRYAFLRLVMRERKAEAIITAHHQDDILETMFVNMLRGTGPRGLVGYTQSDIIRPLLKKIKRELLAYAKEHKLTWQEDSTNLDERYLRNYVRKQIAPKLSAKQKLQLLTIREELQEKYLEIDSLAKKFLVQIMKRSELNRSAFVVLPYSVQKQIMATSLHLQSVELDKKMIEKAVLAIKTLSPGKHVELKRGVTLWAHKKTVLLKVDTKRV